MIERLEATLTKYNQLQTELMSEDVLKNINKTSISHFKKEKNIYPHYNMF